MDNVKKLCVDQSTKLGDIIKVINTGRAQIALVVDAEKHLIGTVTDGDIRRGLLSGETLYSQVKQFMFKDYSAVTEKSLKSEVLALMRQKSLQQIPVLDEDGRVLSLYLREELLLPESKSNWIVFMAGGQGERLRPLTESCPKPMLMVKDKPILEILFEQCFSSGFTKFFISVNYLKQQIIDYFGDGSRWGVEINYLQEQKQLGTAGALSLLPQKPNDPFLVINADVLTRIDIINLLRFHQEQNSDATIAVLNHEITIPYGVVHSENSKVLSIEEKPLLSQFVNAGIYVIEPHILNFLTPNVVCDMPDLLESVIQKNLTVSAFPIHEYWIDVGHHEKLQRANWEW
jgi:dTDP-glucose pyrophosphorylase